MHVTVEEVRHLASLGRIELSEAEVAALTDQLGAILDYVAVLQEIDTTAVLPFEGRSGGEQTLRPDEIDPPLTSEEALSGAGDAVGGLFRVPRVIQE